MLMHGDGLCCIHVRMVSPVHVLNGIKKSVVL